MFVSQEEFFHRGTIIFTQKKAAAPFPSKNKLRPDTTMSPIIIPLHFFSCSRSPTTGMLILSANRRLLRAVSRQLKKPGNSAPKVLKIVKDGHVSREFRAVIRGRTDVVCTVIGIPRLKITLKDGRIWKPVVLPSFLIPHKRFTVKSLTGALLTKNFNEILSNDNRLWDELVELGCGIGCSRPGDKSIGQRALTGLRRHVEKGLRRFRQMVDSARQYGMAFCEQVKSWFDHFSSHYLFDGRGQPIPPWAYISM